MSRTESYKQSENQRLHLNLRRLSPFGQLAWIRTACMAVGEARRETSVGIDFSALADCVKAVLGDSRFRGIFPQIQLYENDPAEPDASDPFVFLAGSSVFSPKLISRFRQVYVEPSGMPFLLEPRLYWRWIALPDIEAGLGAIVEALEDPEARREYEDFMHRLKPADRLVTLLTSVFRGDDFLEGFLSNISGLELYGRCEHFLIRPGSPGQEHPRLMAHVRQWPASVYVNLSRDPGLYEVWNLGARLATGRYLSSANLDDRRAPEHLSVLVRELEANRDIAVASTALRVSETPNLKWEESDSCPVWFGDLGCLNYGGDGLFKETEDGPASRNLPHCMPVWRRQLHAVVGWFDERAYGPSADWEFWLRAGRKGVMFRLLEEPLGLYLKHKESYWRRAETSLSFDEDILDLYGGMRGSGTPPAALPRRPFALDSAVLPELAENGAWLELAGWWLECIERLQSPWCPGEDRGAAPKPDCNAPLAADAPDLSDKKILLLQKHGQHYFGIGSLQDPELAGRLYRSEPAGEPEGILRFIIDLLHRPGRVSTGLTAHVLEGALTDGYVCTGDPRWLAASAFLYRRLEDERGETALLQSVWNQDSKAFLYALQDAYRFTVALPEILRKVDGIQAAGAEEYRSGRLNIRCFPDYYLNDYQKLLYRRAERAGSTVCFLKSLDEMEEMQPVPGRDNILHIHWLDPVWKAHFSKEEFAGAASEFLGLVKRIKARGIALYWTVHNEVSHQCVDPEGERALRRSLFELSDRVYIHHPLVPELVDWLHPDPKIRLAEHGNYLDAPSFSVARSGTLPASREKARRDLNLKDDELLLLHFGQMKPYKDLQAWLPRLFSVMESEPRLKLLLAGEISTPELRELIAGNTGGGLMVRDAFIPEDELEACGAAADFVFLSYRRILTSGSLFKAFTWGVPAIAPRLGTIPAYVVEGWNGFTYGTGEELRKIIRRCLAMTPGMRSAMAYNAFRTARSLRWQFP